MPNSNSKTEEGKTPMANKPTKTTSSKKGEEKLVSWLSVPIPHLRATLHLFDMSKLKGVPIKGSAYTCVYQERPEDLKLDIAIFIQDIEKIDMFANSPMIAHELIHVLQILCDERNMGITDEREHLAFLMSYLMEKILKYNHE